MVEPHLKLYSCICCAGWRGNTVVPPQKAIYTANSLGATMADAEGAKFQRKTIRTFYALLFIAGVAIYWAWGVIYGIWNPFTRGDIAIYTVVVPLIAFGIIGLLLYRKNPAGE
jgi:hypothetical protein